MSFQIGSLFVTAPHRPERMLLAYLGPIAPFPSGEPACRLVCLNRVCPDVHMGDVAKVLKASSFYNDLVVPKNLDLSSIPVYEGGVAGSLDKLYIVHDPLMHGPDTVNFSSVFSISSSMSALSHFFAYCRPHTYKIVLNHIDFSDRQLDHDFNQLALDVIPARADLVFPQDGLSGDDLWEKARAYVDGPLRRQYYTTSLIRPMMSLRKH